jgi:hypothetical protein
MSAPKLLTSLLFCFSLVGCGASDSEETTNTTNTNTYTPYDGSCPTFVEGENTAFQSAGLNRTIQIRLPADPLGAPVVFGWHWLGGTATEIITWLGLNTMVDEGAIVIAPESVWAYV